jgi:hypothetical protein
VEKNTTNTDNMYIFGIDIDNQSTPKFNQVMSGLLLFQQIAEQIGVNEFPFNSNYSTPLGSIKPQKPIKYASYTIASTVQKN